LIDACSQDLIPPVRLVRTPDSPRLQAPGEVPFLFEALKRRERGRLQTELTLDLLGIGAGCFTGYLGFDHPLLFAFGVAVGLVGIAQSFRSLRNLRRVTRDNLSGDLAPGDAPSGPSPSRR